MVDVESTPLEQITKQLFKLINVVKISELDPDDSVEREFVEHRQLSTWSDLRRVRGTSTSSTASTGRLRAFDDFEH